MQYSNGQFYGKESKEITKTLLCAMIKSVCGKYRDIVAMVSDIGFVVVATMTDDHTSNDRFFKKLLGNNNFSFFIEDPYTPGNKIFLHFDPVHFLRTSTVISGCMIFFNIQNS